MHAWNMLPAALFVLALNTACTPDPGEASGSPAGPRQPPSHLVELADVARDTLRMSSLYTGSLASRRTASVFTQEEGKIVKLPYYEGDRVAAGDTVLELDNRLLQAEIDKVVATRRQAEASIERLGRLRDRNLVSEDEFLRAETVAAVAKAEERVLQTRLGYTRVTAPFDGVIAERHFEPGDFVERNAHVLTIIDPQSLVAELHVSELVIPHLGTGDPVRVQIDALGDGTHEGRVLRIHPELDAATRQGVVEIELVPVPDGARAGQFARVSFRIEAFDRLVVPFAAVRRDGEGEYVYRLDDDLTVQRVPVRTGRRLANRVEVLDGLGEGERLVVRGFLGLAAGKKVEPVEGGQAPAAPVN